MIFKKKQVIENEVPLFDSMDFVLHEEYRLLRTNIKYSLTDDKKSHVIGVTSSTKGEAKSTTAINLAYTLAENGEKVCLIEGDMRLPTFIKKMHLEPHVGLSELLTSQAKVADAVEIKKFDGFELAYIQAGKIPPNPSELLSSKKLDKILAELSETYTYIIFDLPPVTIVSDAVVVGDRLDGVIMVVSQSVCTKRLLDEAMRQLTMSRIRILGFVRTLANEQGFSFKYGKSSYRGHYQYGKSSDK